MDRPKAPQFPNCSRRLSGQWSDASHKLRPKVLPKSPAILTYLTETINWYRGTVVEQQIANEPGDITFAEDNRRISRQIVRLAFDFARQEEQSESKPPKANQTPDQANTLSQHQRLIQAVAKADQQVERSQNELQSLQQKLQTAPQKMRPALESLIAETQSELAFRQARRDALHKILQFTAETSAHGREPPDCGPRSRSWRVWCLTS